MTMTKRRQPKFKDGRWDYLRSYLRDKFTGILTRGGWDRYDIEDVVVAASTKREAGR